MINEYIDKRRNIQDILLDYLDDMKNPEDEHILYQVLEQQEIKKNPKELQLFVSMISKIAENHFRSFHFFDKIEKILMYFKIEIKQTFSNHELFLIFKKCRRILLFLFEEEFIFNDKFILTNLYNDKSPTLKLYLHNHIFVECQFYLRNRHLIEDNFENKAKVGENDSYLCGLIRNDSIDDFIQYINKTNTNLSNKIEDSIFETNAFLIENDPNLIEYAAFFGAIQIFKYLKLNGVELTPSLWLYAIHGHNPEIIQLLEEDNVEPEDKSYEKCLKESIKCHHNEIACYIMNNYLDQNFENINFENNFKDNVLSYCFHYFNFEFLPTNLSNFSFFYLCKYNYSELVELFIQNKEIDLTKKIKIVLKEKYSNSIYALYNYKRN